MRLDKFVIIPTMLIMSAIISNIFLDYYTIPKRFIRIDQSQHFYDMKKWYESGKFPTTSARFIASQVVNDELTTPRVPGGVYYIIYTLFYRMSGESLLGAKIINLVFNLVIIAIFLFWFYKKFGLIITSLITPLILCNGYFVMATTDFWNPNVTLIFSFLLFIFLFEYIGSGDERIVRVSAVLIFPILAIMAQAHFYVFFSIVPALIIYLILRFKRTLKYILFWIFGVFLSFTLYLPYLISEIRTDFNNLKLIFETKEIFNSFPFPQIHALLIFPSNEMSVFYGGNFTAILNYWNSNPYKIFCLILLFISCIFVFYCFLRSVYFVFNRKYAVKYNNEKTIIEMSLILLISIPTTIIFNVLFVPKVGAFHYFYPFFSLSYLPIMLFFIQNENKIKLNDISLYLFSSAIFINMFALILQISFYINNYEKPLNIDGMKMIVETIFKDSKGEKIDVRGWYSGMNDIIFRDIAITYFPDMVWEQDSESTNVYIVFDRIKTLSKPKEDISNYKEWLKNNAILLSDNGTLFVYKYDGNEPLIMPNKK